MALSIRILCISTFLLTKAILYAQEQPIHTEKLMFYNVENLFDTIDDPKKNDNEFTPTGEKRWNNWKLRRKIINLYKVITAAGNPEPPALIGLCEIENKEVLNALLYDTPLFQKGYRIIHHESPDRRGIDVAIFYQTSKVKILKEKAIEVKKENNTSFKTRDILYAKVIIHNLDTINLYINHWPSRYGGVMQSQHKRILASRTLKNHIDSIYQQEPTNIFIITGDFNDTPDNESIQILTQSSHLDFCSFQNHDIRIKGTHKFRNHWNTFDQFIISRNLKNYFDRPSEIKANIMTPEFLIIEDKRYGGIKPNRTYNGYQYQGGFSDHFPIILDLPINAVD